MKWEFVARTCSLAAKKSYRSAEFPNSAEKRKREFAIPTAEKISIFARTNFCRYATMRVANSRLFTVAELQIRQNKGKNVRLQPKGRKNSPEPRVTDAGRHLRSVTVGRNELRHKTPSATSTLKECPNCNS